MRLRTAIIVWIGLGLGLAAVLEFLPKPQQNLFWGVVYNTGHVPLFGVGAIVLLQLSKLLLRRRVGHYRYHYYLAFLGCGALGFASELAQFFDPWRDADPWDIARDLLGAGVFLSIAATFDSRAHGELRWAATRPRLVRAIAGVALVANFIPIVFVALAYRHRDGEFPRLGAFDSYWDTWFYATHHSASGDEVSPPTGWSGHDGSRVLEVTFRGGSPRLEMLEPSPDWTDYGALVVDIFSVHDDAVELIVRIRDRVFHDNPANRYERAFSIAPGPNRLEIDLGEIRAGPTVRELNLATVRSITFLVSEPRKPVRLYFDNLRLE